MHESVGESGVVRLEVLIQNVFGNILGEDIGWIVNVKDFSC